MNQQLHILLVALVVVSCISCTRSSNKANEVAESSFLPIATLQKMVRDVKSRRANKFIWVPAREKMGLGNRDAVMTGEGSTGDIRFNDSTNLHLKEKTMVIVLDKQEKKAIIRSVVALPRGDVDGQLKDNTEKQVELVIRTRRGWITAKNKTKSGKGRKVKFRASVSPNGEVKIRNEGDAITFKTKHQERIVPAKKTVIIAAPFVPLPEIKKKREGQGLELPPEPAVAEDFEQLPEVEKQEWKVVEEEPEEENEEEVLASIPEVKERKVVKPVIHRFVLKSPKEKLVVTKPALTVEGEIFGDLEVYLMGELLKPNENGKFSKAVALNLGINTLTFQIIGPGKNQVRYETRDVIRR